MNRSGFPEYCVIFGWFEMCKRALCFLSIQFISAKNKLSQYSLHDIIMPLIDRAIF